MMTFVSQIFFQTLHFRTPLLCTFIPVKGDLDVEVTIDFGMVKLQLVWVHHFKLFMVVTYTKQNVLEFGMHLCSLCVSEICGRVAEEGENIIMTLARSRRRLLCASSPCHRCAFVFTSAANSCCISSVCRPARRWVGSVWRCARLSGLPVSHVCIGRLFKRIQCHADFWNQVCVTEGQQKCGVSWSGQMCLKFACCAGGLNGRVCVCVCCFVHFHITWLKVWIDQYVLFLQKKIQGTLFVPSEHFNVKWSLFFLLLNLFFLKK